MLARSARARCARSDRRGGSAGASGGAATLAVILVVIFVSGSGSGVFAHRRDELLQAARIALEPARVEMQLDLTPGIAVADAVIADIDRNGDGVLSPEERQAYVAQVMQAVTVDIDGRAVQMRLATSSFPGLDALRRGEGTIRIDLQSTPASASEMSSYGAHRLSYRNTHRRDISVYLANALVPDSDRIAINDLQRDTDQRDLTIDYVLRAAGPTSSATWLARVWVFGWIAAAGALAAACVAFRRGISRRAPGQGQKQEQDRVHRVIA